MEVRVGLTVVRASEVLSHKTTVHNIGGSEEAYSQYWLDWEAYSKYLMDREAYSQHFVGQENKLRLLSMVGRHPSLLQSSLKDASTLINKMERNLNSGDMRLVK